MKKGCISIFLDTKKLRKGGLYKRKKEGRLLELGSYTSDGNRVLAFNVLFVFNSLSKESDYHSFSNRAGLAAVYSTVCWILR